MKENRHIRWVYDFMEGKPYNQQSIIECYNEILQKYKGSTCVSSKRAGIRDWWYSHHNTTKEEAPQDIWAECEYILTNSITNSQSIRRKPINTYYILTTKDYYHLINHPTASNKQKLFIELLGTTGMRIGEAVNLKWSDAVFEKGDSVEFIRIAEKTKRQVRFEIKKDLLNRIKNEFELSEFLLTTRNGRPYAKEYITNQIKKLGKRAIKQSISSHSLRRFFVSYHMEVLKTPYYEIAYLLGHINPQNFLVWYNKPTGAGYDGISKRRSLQES